MSDSKKVLVYQYEDEITYYPSKFKEKETKKSQKAINNHHVGNIPINIFKDGIFSANPEVKNHQNYQSLVEATHRFIGSLKATIIVKIYSDGSKEIEVKK